MMMRLPGQSGHAPGPGVEAHRAAGPRHGGAAWPGPGLLSGKVSGVWSHGSHDVT